MKQAPGKMEVRHKGRRYWGSLSRFRNGQWYWRFWSDHKWPFFHGSYRQRALDYHDAYAKFLEWLPFEVTA